MAKAIGFGGIFFKSRDPAALGAWRAKHLDPHLEGWGGVRFGEDGQRAGYTPWQPPA